MRREPTDAVTRGAAAAGMACSPEALDACLARLHACLTRDAWRRGVAGVLRLLHPGTNVVFSDSQASLADPACWLVTVRENGSVACRPPDTGGDQPDGGRLTVAESHFAASLERVRHLESRSRLLALLENRLGESGRELAVLDWNLEPMGASDSAAWFGPHLRELCNQLATDWGEARLHFARPGLPDEIEVPDPPRVVRIRLFRAASPRCARPCFAAYAASPPSGRATPAGRDLPMLTPTENRVAAQVAAGSTNHEIAATLGCHATTVQTHLRNIHLKLGIHHRSELAARWLRHNTP